MKNSGEIPSTPAEDPTLKHIFSLSSDNKSFAGESLAAETAEGNFDMLPPEVREQMIRQTAEVKRLKEQLDRELEHHQETKTELNETIQNLMNEKNELNEKISKLEQVKFLKILCFSFFS